MEKLQWSQYNHLFKSEKFGYLLFNAESNTFAQLDDTNFKLMKSLEANPENVSKLEDDLKEQLIRRRILVTWPEEYYFRRRYKYFMKAFDTANLGLAVAPTTDCNFVCPYCYEKNKKHAYMTEKTENDLLSFIRSYERVRTLNLTWYGGEPLLGFKTIEHVLNEIDKINHLKLGLHNMPTNGYLLDEAKCRFFSEHPMTSIQITLDGDKEHHNKNRMLAGNLPTFDQIIANADMFMHYNPNTIVYIRMNLDRKNEDSFKLAHKQLSSFWKGRHFHIYPAFIKDFSVSCRSNCNLLTRDEKIDFYIGLHEECKIPVDFKANNKCTGLCGATVQNYYVIGPEGEMYKCWNDLGDQERIVGYLDQKGPNAKQYSVLTKYMAGPTILDDEECKKCTILPICAGGCLWERHKKIYEGIDYDYSCCIRKGNLPKILEQQYDQMLKKQAAEFES